MWSSGLLQRALKVQNLRTAAVVLCKRRIVHCPAGYLPTTAISSTSPPECFHSQCCPMQAGGSPHSSPRMEPPLLLSSTLLQSAATPFLLCHVSYAPSRLTELSHSPLAFSTMQALLHTGAKLVGSPTLPVILCNPRNSFTCSVKIMEGESNPAPASLKQFPNLLSRANLRKSNATKKEQLCPVPQAPSICCCHLISVTSQVFALISSCHLGRENPFNPAV